jgi:glycosyltransferase involved in cell wall biosynthesis
MVPAAKEAGVDCRWMSESTFWVGPRALANLALQLLREPPQILYTLTVVPNIWGRLFGRLARVPVIVSGWRDLHPKQYESWLWRLSSRIITNSGVLKDIMTSSYGVDPLRVAVVQNGVDAEHFCPDYSLKAKEPTILFVGRLAKVKDPLMLLEAFRLTVERVPEARLEIVGNGTMRQKLEAFVRRHGLSQRVKLIPGVDDIRPLLRRAWIFAITSLQEASPNVILEAMACELPVVGTQVGGIPELVKDQEMGLLVEKSDPTAAAEAFIRLLNDDAERQAMGKSGREKVLSEHSMERMIRETEQVLIQTAAEKLPCSDMFRKR